MKKTINREEAFSCASGAIAVGHTTAGYTLQYSTDGVNFTDFKVNGVVKPIPADEDLFIPHAIVGTFWKLKNNADTGVVVLC